MPAAGYFWAINAASGAVIWSRLIGFTKSACQDAPGGIFGVGPTAVVNRSTGVVYATGGDGSVWSLSMVTGTPTKGWPVVAVNGSQLFSYGALTLYDGYLYVTYAGYCDTVSAAFGHSSFTFWWESWVNLLLHVLPPCHALVEVHACRDPRLMPCSLISITAF